MEGWTGKEKRDDGDTVYLKIWNGLLKTLNTYIYYMNGRVSENGEETTYMVTLQGSDIFLKYDVQKGIILSLKNGEREYVKEKISIFEIAQRDQAGEQSRVNVSDMKVKSYEKKTDSFHAVYEGSGLTVNITACVADSIQWKIAIKQGEYKALEWVDFPRLAVPNDLKDSGGKSKILWGYNEGVIVDDLTHKEAGDY